MPSQNLAGKRVLITQADAFMGPVLCEVFAEHGAAVIADSGSLLAPEAPAALIETVGIVDILVANLALPAPATPAAEVSDTEWEQVFAALVDPLPRLVRAVVPQMIARRAGKILVMGSASALRGMKRAVVLQRRARRPAGLCAGGRRRSRAAQRAGQCHRPELRRQPDLLPGRGAGQSRASRSACRARFRSAAWSAPARMPSSPPTCAAPPADCFVGQVFPVCGGWVSR